VDFTAEVERSLRVLDGAVAVFDAVAGVQPQSETVWRQGDKYHVPRICFINKVDRIGADFNHAVETIRTRLNARPVPIQLPIGKEEHYQGAVDLFKMKAVIFRTETMGAEFEVTDIPADLQDEAKAAREYLVETVSEHDDALMDKFLGGEEISEAELRAGLRRATIALKLVPVVSGTAFKNKGVQPLLDAVVDFLPFFDRGGWFSPLRDPDYFVATMIILPGGAGLTWPEEINYSSDLLRQDAFPFGPGG